MIKIRLILLYALMALALTISIYQFTIARDSSAGVMMLSNFMALYFFSLLFSWIMPSGIPRPNNFFYTSSFAPMYAATALLVVAILTKPEQELPQQLSKVLVGIGFLVGLLMRWRPSAKV